MPLNDGFDAIELKDPGENGCHGYELGEIRLKPNYSGSTNCQISEMEWRKLFSEKCLPIEGIYETADEKGWRVACAKQDDGTYHLVFLENGFHKYWTEGALKAEMRTTATPGLFKAKWWDSAFHVLNGVLISCDGTTMKVASSGFALDNGSKEMLFVKMYPNSSKASSDKAEICEGTGFALKDGYLVTNYHVVEGASDVRIWREIGGAQECAPAQIVASDKNKDLALLKSSFTCTNIPYSVARAIADVGENVFALGFPLVETMGKEMKLTTGVISSNTGFMGDQSKYQVTAAIQPGNSGGPLFNDKGVVIGVVVAKHLGAENANYAIKSSELRRFLVERSYGRTLPTGNSRRKMILSDKVRALREYVYRIECISGGGSFSAETKAKATFPVVDAPHKTKRYAHVLPQPLAAVLQEGQVRQLFARGRIARGKVRPEPLPQDACLRYFEMGTLPEGEYGRWCEKCWKGTTARM